MIKTLKTGLMAVAVAGLLSLSATVAEAKGFSAGHYRVTAEGGTTQTLCLRSNGTWFGTSFANWSGRWVNRNLNGTLTGFLWGNFDNGAGNDSFIALGVANSKWTEWFDSGATLIAAYNQVRIVKLSSGCPVLSPRVRRAGEKPAKN